MTRTSQEPARPPVRLEMSIAADWDRIDPVREAVERLVGVASRCPDASSALAMVSAELLENAVKYGKPGKGSVSYVLEERAAEIVIVVTNEAAPGRSLVELDERLA